MILSLIDTIRPHRLLAVFAFLLLASCSGRANEPDLTRGDTASTLPAMRWDHRPEAAAWTRSTLAAIRTDGTALLDIVPTDIMAWCPAYPRASRDDRAAFWSGILSALAKHESTWNPQASGGGGRWIGLTQIDPRTARAFGCDATSVEDLKDGSANLACAVKIAAAQVSRDGALVSQGGKWRGLGRDWAPFRSEEKRADMAGWTRQQAYCRG